MAFSKQERSNYASLIVEAMSARYELEGEEPGDYADARRYYIEDASDQEILADYQIWMIDLPKM